MGDTSVLGCVIRVNRLVVLVVDVVRKGEKVHMSVQRCRELLIVNGACNAHCERQFNEIGNRYLMRPKCTVDQNDQYKYHTHLVQYKS